MKLPDESIQERTRRLQAADQKHLWHPFTPMQLWLAEPPLVIEAGEGFHLIDSEGRRYIDGVSSLWCNLHGHRVPEIDQAVRDQLDRIAHSTLLGLASTPSIELAEALLAAADMPGWMTRVFYSDSGSEAVEIAAKIAYQYWQNVGQPQRRRFIAFREGYHGDTIGSVSLGGIGLFHGIYRPLLFETTFVDSPCPHVHPAGARAGEGVLGQIERALAEYPGEYCAVVIEPLVQGAGGMLTHPPGFLRAVRELTGRHGVLLIADEVATGFGRTGRMLACHHEDVRPDLLCVAKGITGGYLPLAATLTTEEIFSAFLGPPAQNRTFFHGHTYTGNALACAAALASLTLLATRGVLAAAPAKIEQIARHLRQMEKLPHVARTRQCGFMVGIDLVQQSGQPFDPAQRTGAAVCLSARRHGIIIRPLGDTLVLMPAPGMDEKTLEALMAGVRETIEEHFKIADCGLRTSDSLCRRNEDPPGDRKSGSHDFKFPALPRARGFFITGTDTGVGKTVIAGAIAEHLGRSGLRVGVFKPAASGCVRGVAGGELISQDGQFLAAAAGSTLDQQTIVPQRFQAALAPNVAAQREGRSVDLQAVFDAYARVAGDCDCMVVEGVGGLLCPITDDFWVIHFARLCRLPLVIVARPNLGTINHTLLTIQAARSAGLEVAGVVINRLPAAQSAADEENLAIHTNGQQIADRGNVRVLAVVPDDPDSSVEQGSLGQATRQAIAAADWAQLL